jgi:prepilin-type N-terminal cleavage/methylation domain-containing protein
MPTTVDTHSMRFSRARNLVGSIRRRLQGDEGFTLVELTIVLLILGILMTIAIPSYLAFKDRASKQAAKADAAQAMRAIISYGADNFPNSNSDPDASTTDNGYTGMDLTALATKYDASISTAAGQPYILNPAGFTSTAADFCLTATVGRWVAVQHGPGSGVSVGTLFTPGTCTVS